MSNDTLQLVECPRDAMQGLHDFIPTQLKADYINLLLRCGFDTIDFGSFVSPKAIPQLSDTADVLRKLELDNTSSKLLAIVANQRGAEEACAFDEISFLGYPFSISETFQLRNTNATIAQSLSRVEEIQSLCVNSRKELVVYISMAFGNPYGDAWNADIAIHWTQRLAALGIRTIALADTTGVSNPENITYLFSQLIPEFEQVRIGAHLHTTPSSWREKMEAAWNAGCRRFDHAVKGFGGCPMAADELTGNMASENVLSFLHEIQTSTGIDQAKFAEAMRKAVEVFPA
ncbi:MAG: hydroxymethylglutaryl-CoA lyase [Bacteroidetes bacterium]|nr:hydroxymethylglutaryl-CoA lyase [Bacteroidota bacterium]